MGSRAIVPLPFPVGGLDESRPYSANDPATTPDTLNVRPFASPTLRARGGPRPAFSKYYTAQAAAIGSAGVEHIRMLVDHRVVGGTGQKTWTLPSGSNEWSTPKYDGVAGELFWLDKRFGTNHASSGAPTTAKRGWNFVREDMNGANDYTVSFLWTHEDTSLFVDLWFGHSTNTSTSPPMHVELRPATNNIIVYEGGAQLGSAILATMTQNQTHRVTVSKVGATVLIYYQDDFSQAGWDVNGVARSVTLQSNLEGNMFGLVMDPSTTGQITARQFNITYSSDGLVRPNHNLLLSSAFDSTLTSPGGGLWIEEWDGTDVRRVDIDPDGEGYNLADSVLLHGASRGDAVFIADPGSKVSSSGSLLTDGQTLRDLNANFVSANVRTHDAVVILTADDVNAVGSFRIASVSATELVLTDPSPNNALPLANTELIDVTYRVERIPKYYKPLSDTFGEIVPMADETGLYGTDTAALKGPVPSGNPLVALYRDRLVLAGNPAEPQLWYMSRQGDPYDWALGGDPGDEGRPIAGSTTVAGRVGEPITALIPFSDDYLIIGCHSEIWMIVGDPAFGGQIDNLSREVGIVSKGSWCRTPAGDIWGLTRDGLYTIFTGPRAKPVIESRKKLPDRLLNIDETAFEILMSYDINEQGLHLYLTPNDNSDGEHWWYDIRTDSYWPVRMGFTSLQPFSIVSYEADQQARAGVVHGSRDGYFRWYRRQDADDDGFSYPNHVVYGPFALGGTNWNEGIVVDTMIETAQETTALTYEYYVGITAQDAYDKLIAATTPDASGTLSSGLNRRIKSRVRGGVLYIKLLSSNNTWAMENITVRVRMTGDRRA